MTNRLFSVLFAAAVTCLALALSIQRKALAARVQNEEGTTLQQLTPEPNIPGYSFSKN